MSMLRSFGRAAFAARHWRTLVALPLLAALGDAGALTLDTRLVAAGFDSPLAVAMPQAGGPLFVVEQGGMIKAVQGGVARDFLSVPVAVSGEEGLLGLAFDPGYANPASAGYRRFFVDAIDPVTRDTVIASYRTSVADPLRADPASRIEVLRVDQPDGLGNHKAGWLGFKPGDADHLYIATGDGGSGYDPFGNGQKTNVLLGKLLRVDVNRDDFAADPNRNYAIPADNPFVATAGARGEIFALGLRNPFRNGFDRQTGDLWIADVGQDQREEIDRIAAASAGGQNFGWNLREGDIATPGVGGAALPGMTEPLLSYDHSFGAAVVGGYVVRQAGSPLFGKYVFGDFISGRIWAIDADGAPKTLADATELTELLNAGQGGRIGHVAAFGEGADGSLYIVDLDGKVVQVQVLAVPEPSAVALWLGGGVLLGWRVRRRAGA